MPVFADLLPEPTIWWFDPSSFSSLWLLKWLSTTSCVTYCLVLLFCIVCMWIIFKKAGRKWREAIIPFWNSYVSFDIVWKKNRFWFLLLPGIAQAIILWIWNMLWIAWSQVINILCMICWIVALIWLVLAIIMLFKLAKKFGKSWWFGLWLLFLSPIFLWILAFWKAQYHK